MIRIIFLSALFLQTQAYFESMKRDVKESFERNKIVPDVIKTAPEEFVEVAYRDGSIVFLGNELSVPSVAIRPKRVSWEADQTLCYTLAFVDPDAPSRSSPKFRNVKHWLIVNIKGNDLRTGTTLASYLSPTPPGSDLHRYTYIIFVQPRCNISFDENNLKGNVDDRYNFNVKKFAKKYDLKPFAGNFFVAKNCLLTNRKY